MSYIKKILFTTAYSTSSKNTWRYALRLAQHFEARIYLLHVYHETKSALLPGNDFILDQELDLDEMYDEEQYRLEKNRLQEFAIEYTPREYQSVPVSFIVTTGNVVEAILEEERETNYDLIVLGTSTATTANRFWGGSALKVLARTKTPVFLVPPMAKYNGIHRIVYATNFESGDIQAIQQLMQWIHAFGAKLHLLHVYKKTYGAKQAAERMQMLMRTFEVEDEAGMMNYQLLEGQAVQNIESYLDYTDADMIALTTHQRGVFAQLFDPGVTNQIATEVMVPILVFKQK